MKAFIASCWTVVMDNRYNPLRHLDLSTQHYFMQVLGWMWSMVFSLTFLSIFQFGLTWLAHVFLIGGIAMTVALFRESEKQRHNALSPVRARGETRCVWKLDTEA